VSDAESTTAIPKKQIREAAQRFAKSFEGVTQERAESQTFWNDFFQVFGVERRSVALYESIALKASSGRSGRIDVLWPGQMAVEHKSADKSLDDAMDQLVDYLPSLPAAERPWLLVVSDFQRFRWHNLETGDRNEFACSELHDNLQQFLWMAGHEVPHTSYETQEAASLDATELLSGVYKALKKTGYPDGDLREWLTRILFCLFADDAGVWDRDLLHGYLTLYTAADGHDLGGVINNVFRILNTPPADRPGSIDEDLASFTFINGDLFSKDLWQITGDAETRESLLLACRFDWSQLSPAIFGSMFQNVMTAQERRQLGAHYTTEANILRTIRPLFVEDLEAELRSANTFDKLTAFHDKIAGLRFMDPACGCGNFLVIAYRELRRLETECLRRLEEKRPQPIPRGPKAKRLRPRRGERVMNLDLLCKVRVDQFYGIEIEEFPARIARTALYLIDHIANREVSAEFGEPYVRFPIPAAPHIHHGNALDMDWNALLPAAEADYVFGNPPFVGKKKRTTEQQADMTREFGGAPGTNDLDYVTAWFQRAVRYSLDTEVKTAFVATNSITQGEQVPVLWPRLEGLGARIGFAHRPFKWTSEASGTASVIVVIVGFALGPWGHPIRLFEYQDSRGEPTVSTVSQINGYLAEAPAVYPLPRSSPLGEVPSATFGSMPNDDHGKFLLTDEEAEALRVTDPIAAKYLREIVSTKQVLNGVKRWCLWLVELTASDRRASPELTRRIKAVGDKRRASTREATRALAATPHLFGEIRQPTSGYLCVPRHVGENRRLLPMVFFGPEVIASDSTEFIVGADHYLFGVLQSAMFDAWLRNIGGRIKTDLRFSIENVYNTFPFIEVSEARRNIIAEAAIEVLDVRSRFPDLPLVDLYDPLSIPRDLSRAHDHLDRVVDAAFTRRQKLTEAVRVTVLLDHYQRVVAAEQLPGVTPQVTTLRRPRRAKVRNAE
jgi:hypothetical protein